MAQSRIQCLNSTKRLAYIPREIRAAFSKSAVARAGEIPSFRQLTSLITVIENLPRFTAADGLLASLDEHEPSRPPSTITSSPPTNALPKPIRLPVRQPSHAPTHNSNQRVAAMISQTLARRVRQNQSSLTGRRPGHPSLTTVQELENAKKASDLSKQITRRWKAGDVYAPHDLSSVEMDKWRNRDGPKYDVFDVLDFKPLENYRVWLQQRPLSNVHILYPIVALHSR